MPQGHCAELIRNDRQKKLKAEYEHHDNKGVTTLLHYPVLFSRVCSVYHLCFSIPFIRSFILPLSFHFHSFIPTSWLIVV